MKRRVFGFILILLAVVLSIAILGQLMVIISAILSFITIFSGNLTSYEIGRAFGTIMYWTAHFVATYFSWKYGLKWVKKPVIA